MTVPGVSCKALATQNSPEWPCSMCPIPPGSGLWGWGHPTYIFLIFPGHLEFWTPLQIPSWGPPLGCTLLQNDSRCRKQDRAALAVPPARGAICTVIFPFGCFSTFKVNELDVMILKALPCLTRYDQVTCQSVCAKCSRPIGWSPLGTHREGWGQHGPRRASCGSLRWGHRGRVSWVLLCHLLENVEINL